MPNRQQLSAGEGFDDNTGLRLGEGYLTFQSSAGNRIVFNDPAAYTRYRLANPGQFDVTPDTGGTYNTEIETDN